ncbi:MAG: hypothetical protein ACK4VY_05520 [Brevundimonas sp.]
MLLMTMMALAIQQAPAADPPLDIPDSAVRDPYGFVLSHCSPLVRRSSESLDACEHRVGEALRTRLPSFTPRPLATVVASGADDPAPRTGTAFGGRCRTRQDSHRDEAGSSSSAVLICGDDRSGAAASALESVMRPR